MGRSLCEEPARSPYRAWLCPNAEKTWLKHPALEVLKTAFQANLANGDIAAEIGRLALELDHLEIAKPALEVAEQQGVHDWKTLSAEPAANLL